MGIVVSRTVKKFINRLDVQWSSGESLSCISQENCRQRLRGSGAQGLSEGAQMKEERAGGGGVGEVRVQWGSGVQKGRRDCRVQGSHRDQR